jgi:signal transduction histidine kinase
MDAGRGTRVVRSRRRTIRGALLLLILTAIVPAFGLVVLATVDHYRDRRDAEVQASADVARAVAAAFAWYVQDLLRAEYALGVSIAGHGHSPAEIQLELDAVIAEFGTLRALSWVEPGGRVTASTDARLLNTSIYARDYFQELVRGAPHAVSNLMHSLADGTPVFEVARAVALAGEPRGVVVATVDPERLASIIGLLRSGRGATGILDGAGALVANEPRPPDMTWEGRRRASDHPLLRDARVGRDSMGIFLSPMWGMRRIGALAPVQSVPGWVALASRPVADAMAPIRRAVAIRAAAALAVALAALAAAVSISRRIAVPLRQLEAHAAGVAHGERAVAVVRGPAEVERVAGALNEMSEMLVLRRHEAEVALRTALEQRAEVDAVFATAPVGLVHVEAPDRAPRLNQAARDILGLPEDVGPFSEYLRTVRVSRPPIGVVNPSEQPLARALRGESTHDDVLRVEPLPGHAGRACWLSVSAAPVRGPAGAVRGAVCAFIDVTAIRALQEERETLMQMVSHDLRTPLHVIVGHAQLLHRGGGDAATVARRADAILASSGRMQRLIEDMVDATRLEAGHLKLHLEPVELARFLPEWKERLAGALEMERVRIAAPHEVPVVLADPARLEQIVLNLVTNALKYSAAGSEVVVTLAADGERMELSVSDHGPGISPDELPRLFDRYYRARNATRAEGLGLGLFITRKLVDAHGWDIRVESELGRGSVFTVVVPTIPSARARATAAG